MSWKTLTQRFLDSWPWAVRAAQAAYAFVTPGKTRRAVHELAQRADNQAQQIDVGARRIDRAEPRIDEAELRLATADARFSEHQARLAVIERELAHKLEAPDLARFERQWLDMLGARQQAASQRVQLQHSVLLRELIGHLRGADPVPAANISANAPALADFYWALADAFRGPVEAIRARLHPYLDPVRAVWQAHPGSAVLDLGCGRGEWLDTLADSGIPAVGVDDNPLCVEHVRGRGREVEQADILAYLERQQPGRFSVICAFQVVEHLNPADLLRLLKEAWRVLGPGGLLVLETPNPENLQVAARMFHRDPSHRSPLPPELLEFMVEWAGFTDIRVERLNPYPDPFKLTAGDPAADLLNQMMFSAQDYAVLARAA